MRRGTYEGIEPNSRGVLMKAGRRAGLYREETNARAHTKAIDVV
jgi:hypothetical protein